MSLTTRMPGRTAIAILAVTAVIAGCSASGGATLAPSSAPGETATNVAGDPTTDKLAQVLDRGTLVGIWEPDYAPLSWKVEDATRPAGTRCQDNQLTGPEVAGYDNDTTKLVAERLGVEPCFITASWTEVTGGHWGDRWDINYGSGSINADRMTRLWMTQPYYAVENYYYVKSDSPYRVASDLDGKAIGTCASCTHEYYLKGELEIPGVDIDVAVTDPQIVTFVLEPPGLQAVADGDIEAFLASAVIGQQALADGLPLRTLDEPAFVYYPSGFVDKFSGLDAGPFVRRVNEIVEGLHADGSLKAKAIEYFGVDWASRAGAFNLDAIGQVLP